MRRLELMALAWILALLSLPEALPAQTVPPAPPALAPMREQVLLAAWLDVVEAHTPGDPGRRAIDLSSWSGPDLEGVIASARLHARALARTDPDLANTLLLKGARLHADIGNLIPEVAERQSPVQQSLYMVSDGRWQGHRYSSMHWHLARALLDAVTPQPGGHPGVRAWYVEVARELLTNRRLVEALVHLARARRLFPSEPDILFYSGSLHECFSSPLLQAGVMAVREEKGRDHVGHSVRAELGQAERHFRQALEAAPDHLEARVRWGRVLGELGRREDAMTQLRRALEEGADGEVRYFAHLILGRQLQALGRSVEARDEFERAATLYPRAQTPRFALSQLWRSQGHVAAAHRELRVLADVPPDERQREDPWLRYFDIR